MSSAARDASTLVADLQQTLRALADPQRAAPMRAYMKNQFEFLGVAAPVRRQAVQPVLAQRPWTAEVLLDVARRLWGCPEREMRYTAIDLLGKNHRCLDLQHLPVLAELLQRDPWWDTVDGLAAVVGDVVRAARRVNPDAQDLMDPWLSHPLLWMRRVAMLHQLGWRQDTDTHRLERYATTLAPETEFFIRKAIGWALRDYARCNPAFVRALLQAGRAHFSPLTRREAGKHLPDAP